MNFVAQMDNWNGLYGSLYGKLEGFQKEIQLNKKIDFRLIRLIDY